MSDPSRTSRLGRLLTVAGAIWVVWALVTGIVGLPPAWRLPVLPILPGIVLLFVGRAVTRRARRRPIEDLGHPSGPTAGGERRTPAPVARQREPDSEPAPTPRAREIRTTPEPEAEAVAEAVGGMAAEIAEALERGGRHKTSAEMVAEAKERFGRRP